MSPLAKSARAHRIERRLQIVAPVTVVVVCVIAVIIMVVKFRLGLA